MSDLQHGLVIFVVTIVVMFFGETLSAGIVVESNQVYAVGTTSGGTASRDLMLDVYRPDDSSANARSALILVHGGSFTSGSRLSPDMVSAALYFAGRGWVCFSIDYRLTVDDPPAPAWIEALNNPILNAAHAATVDTKRAVRWVRTHAGQFNCDSNRVAGLGHSAGAYCVILGAVTDEEDYANDAGTSTPDQWPDYRGKFNAAVDVSGGMEFAAAEFDTLDSPLMIWHGDADTVVPYSEAEDIHAECVDHRIPCQFFTLSGKGHGFETWTALYEGRDIKAHALEFLALFFDLNVSSLAGGSTGPSLSWPSISNAVYNVKSTHDLLQSFTNITAEAITAATDTCTAHLPNVAGPRFYRIGVLSGQARP